MSRIRILAVTKEENTPEAVKGWVKDPDGEIPEFDTAGEALRWLKKQKIETGTTYHMVRIVKTLSAEKKVIETVELAEK